MKTALCLYGQPREFSSNWNYIKNNIIDINNCDVFFHAWYDSNNTHIQKLTPGHEHRHLENNLHNIISKITNAKKYKIDTQIKFQLNNFVITEDQKDKNIEACWPWAKKYDKNIFINDRIKAHYSMWYSINQSVLLKDIYAQENNINYDCVIISRFDVSPKKPLNINNFNFDKLITPDLDHPRGEICDWFMFSNNTNINIIASLYFSIDYYMKKILNENGIWTNEAFLREQVKKYNIESSPEKNIVITF